MTLSPLAGKPAPKETADRSRAARAGVLRAQARADRSGPARELRHQRPSRLAAARLVQRGSYPRDHSGDLRLPACAGHQWPALHGPDTHAVSGPAQRTALEVLAANEVETVIQSADGFTPTPAISRAILVYNRDRTDRLADGIVITPSHNPPEDGGFKYNPPNGGPADTDVTSWIQNARQRVAARGQRGAKRLTLAAARACCDVPRRRRLRRARTWMTCGNVIDMDAIRAARLKLAVDPLGGAAVHYWEPINRVYGLDIEVVNPKRRPDLLVHDRRSRRQDPHGLLEPLRDGPAARAEGPVRRRLRQRPRCGPARHRHPLGGVDESEPLSRRRDPLSAHASPGAGRRECGSRQDARLEQPDRPRRCGISAGACWRCQSDSNGSRRACSTVRCCFGGEESAGASFLRLDGTVGPPTRTA